MSAFRRVMRSLYGSKGSAVLGLAAILVTLLVVVSPIFAARYPPMTDLPFHATHTSILRHYTDPSWHFREQFELQPIAVPYLSHYVIGALLMLVFSPLTSVKIATSMVLLWVPSGMAVLLYGMKKSPLGALFTLPLVYCTLTHWGFINYVGALGLFAMAIGFAMLVLDRPTALRRVSLALTLVVLFFTHIYRFPMALAAVIGTGFLLYPATRRIRPIVLPLLPAVVLFVIWFFVRPKALGAEGVEFSFDWERRKEIWSLLFGGFNDPEEMGRAATFVRVLGFVSIASFFAIFVEDRWVQTRRAIRFSIGSALVPLIATLVLFCLFFSLPMQIGSWWYVYPREATAAVFIAIALLPGLPHTFAARAPLVFALLSVAIGYTQFIRRSYAAFDTQTKDFDEIIEEIPKAPKLLYLIFDHEGTTRQMSPFMHLPAYVQADRGGWLSFNFAVWGATPIAFRDRRESGAMVPPRVPHRWEWTPQVFRLEQHGGFFNWFLIRSSNAPDALFASDPSIHRVKNEGKWWLFARTPKVGTPKVGTPKVGTPKVGVEPPNVGGGRASDK